MINLNVHDVAYPASTPIKRENVSKEALPFFEEGISIWDVECITKDIQWIPENEREDVCQLALLLCNKSISAEEKNCAIRDATEMFSEAQRKNLLKLAPLALNENLGTLGKMSSLAKGFIMQCILEIPQAMGEEVTKRVGLILAEKTHTLGEIDEIFKTQIELQKNS